ncbi:hypothetical protein [Gordonia aurantiaca]|uniref:hypothetical protein n=1 Tax=Gordonia sp. B21 TaxID=3151852 RepID=UPI003266F19F
MSGIRTEKPISTRAAALRIAVAAVVFAAVLVAVGFAWRAERSGADDADARAQLRDVAGTIVADVFSVDAGRWQQDRARARGLVAGEFLDNYGSQLARPPADGAVSIVWRPETVGIVVADADEGQALLRVAVTVRAAEATGDPATTRRSVLARFVRVDDAWRLAAAEVIG